MKLLFAISLAACATTAETEIDQAISTQVTTTGGRVIGYADADLVVFKGIPYAAAPTGLRRWRPPQPIAWSLPRHAIADPAPCPQPAVFTETGGATAAIGVEDCLNVNVWTRDRHAAARDGLHSRR